MDPKVNPLLPRIAKHLQQLHPPMALRIRVLHSFVLGLIGVSLVVYSSYYVTPVQVRYLDPRDEASRDIYSMAQRSLQASEDSTKHGLDVSTAQTDSAKNASFLDNETITDTADPPVNSSLPSLQVPPSELFSASEKPVSVASTLLEDSSSPAVLPVSSRVVAITSVPSSVTRNTTSHVSFHVVHQTTTKSSLKKEVKTKSVLTTTNSTTEAAARRITTRSVYEPGHYIPNVELCPNFGAGLKLIVIITSAPKHHEARTAIRQTWGHFSVRKDVSITFLLGRTNDIQLQKSLNAEAEMFGDIIQSHFIDSYNNLTLKTVSMLEWVDKYCHQVHFILKTDDDMFINVPKLLSFLDKHSKDKRTIFGRLAKKWKPIRNKKSKYYVSPEQYKPSVFPDFTTGPAYLLTGDAVRDLYTAALDKTYLKLEDVYTTGIVAQDIKIKRVHVNEFLNKRIAFHACQIQKGISIHMVKYHEQFDLWKKLLDGRTKCK